MVKSIIALVVVDVVVVGVVSRVDIGGVVALRRALRRKRVSSHVAAK
jgi:hypothetical protein